MNDPLARVEATKLAHQLGVDAAEVAFLCALDARVVRDLRERVDAARFTRHEARFRRLASLTAVAPARVSARIAEVALGPMLAARVAGVMPTEAAVRLAGRFHADFLTSLSTHLDPVRAREIVAALPRDLVVDVGHRLVERGEHVTLGRLVSVVDVEVALAVVRDADALTLLRIAVLTDDPAALDAVVARLDDDRLAASLTAARAAGREDDLDSLFALVSTDTRTRLEALAG